MQLLIYLQDHEGKSHKTTTFKLEDQATIDQLRDKISSSFYIKAMYQELFHNSRRIDLQFDLNSTLFEIGLKHMDKVIVKHALLQHWVSCLAFADQLGKTRVEHLKSRFAREGLKQLFFLGDTSFFLTYSKFFNKSEIRNQFCQYVVDKTDCLKFSVERYFKNYFKNEGLNIEFHSNPDAYVQDEFICQIMNGVDEQFFVKVHIFVALSGSEDLRIDRRELFVYRLLYLIGVGPEPHFIANTHSRCYTSKLNLFIATKKVPGFLRRVDWECDFTKNHEMQLNLLKDVFYLRGPNSNNYGLDGSQKLAILHFGVSNPKNCVYQPEIFSKYSNGEWGDVYKEVWNKWNLLGKFNEVKNMILNDCNQFTSIHWREGYDDYLETVLKNINVLNKLLS